MFLEELLPLLFQIALELLAGFLVSRTGGNRRPRNRSMHLF
jgi:hypothetical protein